MEIPQAVMFNGIEYRLMGAGKYYLSQSKSNSGRKRAKGLHVAIWEFYNETEVPKGYQIHHKDGDTFNNDISNLECLSPSEHSKIHPKEFDDKARKHLDEIRPLTVAWHKSAEGKEWHRKHGIEVMEKRPYIDKICACCGKGFQSKMSYAVYCSPKCYERVRSRRRRAETRLQPKCS